MEKYLNLVNIYKELTLQSKLVTSKSKKREIDSELVDIKYNLNKCKPSIWDLMLYELDRH